MSIWLFLKSKVGIYAVAISGFLITIFAYGRSQKNKGKKEAASEVNAAANKTILKVIKEDKKIEEDIDNKSDDDVLNQLLAEAKDRPDNQ